MHLRTLAHSVLERCGGHVGENAVDRRSIFILARARCTAVGPTRLQGGRVESIDFGLALGDEGCVLFDGVWMVTINPEDRIVYTASDRVSPRILGQLHRARRMPSAPKAVS